MPITNFRNWHEQIQVHFLQAWDDFVEFDKQKKFP